jgi:translocation and assembly module TamB
VPSIEAVGEARMLGHDIRAGITGPYDNPEVELSSTPPLSQETLLVLLLTGQLQQSASEMNSRATATTIAVYIAQDTIGRWFAGDGPVDEDSIFERLELLYGEDVSQNGTETFDVAFRLTAREGLPKELKNRRHWFLTAQRDRYEDYNYGLRIVLRLR